MEEFLRILGSINYETMYWCAHSSLSEFVLTITAVQLAVVGYINVFFKKEGKSSTRRRMA